MLIATCLLYAQVSIDVTHVEYDHNFHSTKGLNVNLSLEATRLAEE